ncbi:hypothetical protein B0H11DRAFT_2215249 [Mycena galericulata]|nr:hypothetical protein B0H11DRAFT_2215249 [Mycena galericulata]
MRPSTLGNCVENVANLAAVTIGRAKYKVDSILDSTKLRYIIPPAVLQISDDVISSIQQDVRSAGHTVGAYLNSLDRGNTARHGDNRAPFPNNAYPKLVALDLDFTVWQGWLHEHFGKGQNASWPIEDNLDCIDFWTIQDRSNRNNSISLFPDVAGIITDLAARGVQIAVVSRNTNKALCDRALWHFQALDPFTNKFKSIINFVNYDEVYNRVTFKMLWNSGLTWGAFHDGLAIWRRNKYIIVHPGLDNRLLPKPKFIGWVGTNAANMQRYRNGERRLDHSRPARWGYGLYITDDPAVAHFFAFWARNPAEGMFVCAMYVWDGNVFDDIWVPDDDKIQTDNNNWEPRDVALKQEQRDSILANKYGIQKPYILFARHPRMNGMQIQGARFNEMVVYPQLQDSLFFSPWAAPVQEFRPDPTFSFEQVIRKWRIHVPNETVFTEHIQKD